LLGLLELPPEWRTGGIWTFPGLGEESQSVGTVYPPEFKAQVVQLAREGEKSYVEIARELGLSPTSVANWVREADAKQRRGGLSADERAELVALRREVKKKDEELAILGKALAFFVRRADR
jgi:transposase